MKKQSLLLLAGGILAFASCNTETANTADDSQAKVDSMVNARVEELRMELEAKNDSIINAMAMMKADSMMAEMAKTGKKPVLKPKNTMPTAKPGSNTGATTTSEKPKGGVDDRPGASNTNKGDGSTSDRPGASNTNKGNGGTSDRPGASNK